jgi:hypothetical protein
MKNTHFFIFIITFFVSYILFKRNKIDEGPILHTFVSTDKVINNGIDFDSVINEFNKKGRQ